MARTKQTARKWTGALGPRRSEADRKAAREAAEKKAFEAPNAEQKAAVDAFAAAIDEAKTTTQLYLASPRIFALKYLGDCPHQPSCKHSLRCMQECHAIPPQQRTERDQRLADEFKNDFWHPYNEWQKLRPNLVAESELDDEEESFLRRFNCLLHLIADVYVHPFTEEMVDDFVSHFFSYFFSDYYGADVREEPERNAAADAPEEKKAPVLAPQYPCCARCRGPRSSRVGSPFCGACRDKVLPERERKQKAREEKEEKGEDPAAVDESSDADTDADTDAAVAAAMEEMDEDIDDDDPAPPKSKRKRKRKADEAFEKQMERLEKKQEKESKSKRAASTLETQKKAVEAFVEVVCKQRLSDEQLFAKFQERVKFAVSEADKQDQDPLCGRHIGSDEDIKKQFAISGRVDIAARVKDGKAIVAKIEENRRLRKQPTSATEVGKLFGVGQTLAKKMKAVAEFHKANIWFLPTALDLDQARVQEDKTKWFTWDLLSRHLSTIQDTLDKRNGSGNGSGGGMDQEQGEEGQEQHSDADDRE